MSGKISARDSELIEHEYNEGRLEGDRKWIKAIWIKAIDERIAELEKQVGIPELRRLREKTRYRWEWKKGQGRSVAEERSKGMRRRI